MIKRDWFQPLYLCIFLYPCCLPCFCKTKIMQIWCMYKHLIYHFIDNAIISIICNTIITGIPIKNLGFFVLWWKVYIPAIAPMLPPIKAKVNSVDSFILHLSFSAFFLSINIAKKAIMFIISKYIIIFYFFAQKGASLLGEIMQISSSGCFGSFLPSILLFLAFLL